MTYKKSVVHLNANAFSVNPGLIQKALVLSGLTWKVPPAQIVALQMSALNCAAVVEDEVKIPCEELFKASAVTLMGLPVEQDRELSSEIIQLCLHGEVIFTIESLAIPWGMEQV